MKKTLFIFAVLLLTACSTNDPEVSTYSTSQQKAFAIFKGTFADIQFSNLSGGSLAQYLPDPDKIVFGTNYTTPVSYYKDDYMNGKVKLFDAQGECSYYSYNYSTKGYDIISCYYCVTTNADKFYLYYKGGSNDKGLYNSYDLSIKSETQMYLQDADLTLPYIFVKQ